jgi:hypothetical protein
MFKNKNLWSLPIGREGWLIFLRWMVKKYLPGYHICKNPTRGKRIKKEEGNR